MGFDFPMQAVLKNAQSTSKSLLLRKPIQNYGISLAAFLNQQLDPDSIDDSLCDSRLASMAFITLGKPLEEILYNHTQYDGNDWACRISPRAIVLLFTRQIRVISNPV
jgi:hypothetical protein